MNKLRNEEGVALITALMFTLISLGMVMALMQMLLSGTKTSGSQKNYRTALDAAYGGTELITKEFVPRLFPNYSSGIGPLMETFGGTEIAKVNLVVNNDSLKVKLSENTSAWGSNLSKTVDPKDMPDVQFRLKGDASSNAGNFNIYGKIVDTVTGNSDTTGVDYLDSGAGVAGTGAGIAPKHNPAMYTIEVRGERATNPREKALLSVLYAY